MKFKFHTLLIFAFLSLINLHFIYLKLSPSKDATMAQLEKKLSFEKQKLQDLQKEKIKIKNRLEIFNDIENTRKNYNLAPSEEAIAYIELLGIKYLDYTYPNAIIITKSEILIQP